MHDNPLIAMTYAQAGVAVFPCFEFSTEGGPQAKSPRTSRGMHDASADPDWVRTAWATYPTAIIGLPCRPNNLIVLDLDRHGREDGVGDCYALFARHGSNLNDTAVGATPNNGLHAIHRRPTNLGRTYGKLIPAVDIKDDGYICAPGSRLANGQRYELLNGTVDQLVTAIAANSLPEPPPWLVAMISKPAGDPTGVQSSHASPFAGDVWARLNGLLATVLKAKPGERNNTLHWAACRVGEMVKADLLADRVAAEALIEAGRIAGLSGHEARATSFSGLRTGYYGPADGR